jgi:hypothetical protein
MNRLRLFVLCSIVAPTLLIAQQKTLEPPAGNEVVLTTEGRGVQIYRCEKKLDQFVWSFVAPEAKLYTHDSIVATHGAGPVWINSDGSSIHGKLIASLASPEADSIPWLILKGVDPTGQGVLSPVTYIRRTDTKGGQPAETGCDADHPGAMSRIPYTATYTFYIAKK